MLLPVSDRDLDHGADTDGDQDLGDRKLEAQADLAQHLEGDDDDGQPKAGIARAGQDQRGSTHFKPEYGTAR